MTQQWVHRQKLNPILSNLLPEGALWCSLLTQGLKIHSDNEFDLLAYLGHDLPGALVVESLEIDDVPGYIFDANHISASPRLIVPPDQLPLMRIFH